MASLTPAEQKGGESTSAPEPDAFVGIAKRKYHETLESSAFAPDSEAYRLLHHPLQKPWRRIQAGPAPVPRPAQRLRSTAWEVGKKTIEGRERGRTFRYSKLEKDEIRVLHLQPGSRSDPLIALGVDDDFLETPNHNTNISLVGMLYRPIRTSGL